MPSLLKKRKGLGPFSLLFIFLILGLTAYLFYQKPIKEVKAQGNTFYVPGNFNSIQAAVNAAQAGDTIMVRGGTYNESVNISHSGQSGRPITLTNYGNETVTINGGGGSAIKDSGTGYWVIEGLRLLSTNEYGLNINGANHHWIIRNNYIEGAVYIHGSYLLFEGNEVSGWNAGSKMGVYERNHGDDDATHHNTYRNNHVYGFTGRGFTSIWKTHDSLWEGNHVHDISGSGTYDTFGITIECYSTVAWRHTIRGNHIHDIAHAGFSGENCYECVLENNIVHDIGNVGMYFINYPHESAGAGCVVGGENGQFGEADGDCRGDINNNIIRQNLIYEVHGFWGGINSTYAGGIKIWGNTVYGCTYSAICPDDKFSTTGESGLTPQLDIRSNILWGNASPICSQFDQSQIIAYQGNVEINPLYVNAAGGNFHLQQGSPAIDAGIDIGLTTDLDGNSRPQGAGYDAGVYEYGGTPGPSPTSTPTQPPSLSLKSGWNQITWSNVSGKKASDIPYQCPMAVVPENSWFRPYVRNYGGVNFNFESNKTYYLYCTQTFTWTIAL